jgi:hypothetical protein
MEQQNFDDVQPSVTPDKQNYSVGMEFVEWAEKHWGMKTAYEEWLKHEDNEGSYQTIRPYLIQKIDEIIFNRLNNQ